MSRFSAVMWDVDGTLLDFVYAQRRSMENCFRSIGREITEEILRGYQEINDRYWKRLELGEVTKQQLLTGRFIDLFERYGIAGVDAEAFRLEYQEGLSNIWKYMDNSLEICLALHGKVEQYAITNGVFAVQEKKLRLSGLYELMDDVFISERIGTPKPQGEFFDHCLAAMKEAGKTTDKSKILIVGDSLTSDIKGGVLYGIPTCWYRPDDIFDTDLHARGNYERYKPDYEISRLSGVLELLGADETL